MVMVYIRVMIVMNFVIHCCDITENYIIIYNYIVLCLGRNVRLIA